MNNKLETKRVVSTTYANNYYHKLIAILYYLEQYYRIIENTIPHYFGTLGKTDYDFLESKDSYGVYTDNDYRRVEKNIDSLLYAIIRQEVSTAICSIQNDMGIDTYRHFIGRGSFIFEHQTKNGVADVSWEGFKFYLDVLGEMASRLCCLTDIKLDLNIYEIAYNLETISCYLHVQQYFLLGEKIDFTFTMKLYESIEAGEFLTNGAA